MLNNTNFKYLFKLTKLINTNYLTTKKDKTCFQTR